MSQKQKILAWLKRRPLSQAQAIAIFGCYRLAARIKELRDEGYDIDTITEPNQRRGVHGVYQMGGL